MEFIGEAHLDVAEDNYKVVPLSNDLLLLIGPHYVNIIKLGDSVLYSLQLDDTNKRNIIRYLPASNKLLHVGKDNIVKILSPTSQGVFVLGDILNDSSVRLSLQEAIYLLDTLQELNWGPDTEDISQRVAFQLQQRIPELQILPAKKQQWLECVLEGTYAELEPLFEDIASQHISDPTQSATVTKLLHRLKLNAAHHPKHPSSSPVVSVAVSDTEEIAVTGASDGTIAIWDISNGARLVNTITGPAGLLEVLLGEVLVSIHQPDTIVVHQIGAHALSETLFQHQLEGSVIMGASYVAASRSLVLALDDVIGSPSKADYYLQPASVNLESGTVELGDRVRVEGGFVAIAATGGVNTVSITQDGFVVLFDSSSASISNSFKKPESTYRFSDVKHYKGFVYAATLGGTILSFNLANISQPSSSSAPSSPQSPQFQGFSSADNNDGEDPFGSFSAAQPTTGDDDFGFGDFASAAPSVPTPDQNINGSPPKSAAPVDDLDELQFVSSFGSPSPAPKTPSTEFSPKFSLDAPGAGIVGSSAANNSSTGDFGELPRSGSGQSSPVIGASKLRQSREAFDFQQSPYSSPSHQRKETPTAPPIADLGDFGEFSKTSPAVERKSPHADPFSSDLKAASPPRSPQKLTETNFGDFGTHNQFGDSEFTQSSSAGQGDFGIQGDPLGDFGAIPPSHPNGLASSPTQVPAIVSLQSTQDQGDFGDFGNFSSTSQQSAGDFEEFSSSQQSADFGDFAATGLSTSPSTSLHASAGHPASAPTTPSLLPQFYSSGSLFPTSPAIFSQNAFADFEAPPPALLSQSGTHSQPPSSNSFDDFGGDFGSAAQSSPSAQHIQTSASPQRSPLAVRSSPSPQRQLSSNSFDTFGEIAPAPQQDSLGDFGEFSTTPTSTQQSSNGDFGDFGELSPKGDFLESAPVTTQQDESSESSDFGDFGQNPTVAVPSGDVAESPDSQSAGDFGELNTTPAPTQDTFGDDFSSQQASQQDDDFGDFGEKPAAAQTDDFGDFGEKPSTQTDDVGDFGERPAASNADDFGDFGERPTAPQTSDEFGDFDEFSAAPSAGGETTTAPADENFGDFGDFAGEDKKDTGDDDFGDFGDFSAPQATTGDDDFGDFGDFSAPAATDDADDFGDFAAPSETATAPADVPTPTPAPVPAPVAPVVPSIPSVFSLEEPELSESLANTFSSAFASLIPSSPSPSSPSSSRIPNGLDLEGTLKGSATSPGSARTQKCARCGVLLRSPDAPSCLACGANVSGAPASSWSGVVLPPIAEIKFWDALGVSIKSMTEKPKEPTALSSSQGILTPVVSTQSTSQTLTPATQPTLSSSWDFSDNPFSPGRVTGAPAASTASGTAIAPSSTTSTRVPATHTQSPAQGLAATPHAGNAAAQSGASSFAAFPASSSSSSSSSSFPTSFSSPATHASSTPAGSTRSADDDFFLNFNSSATPAAPNKSPSLLTTSTPSAQPWTQFLSRIPDLAFVIADKLVLPSH